MKILIFLLGTILGSGTVILFSGGFDLLSSNKGETVSLKYGITFGDHENADFTLPKGTRLKVKSQFDDVGEFCLRLVITDLSTVENSDGDSMYFPNNPQ